MLGRKSSKARTLCIDHDLDENISYEVEYLHASSFGRYKKLVIFDSVKVCDFINM